MTPGFRGRLLALFRALRQQGIHAPWPDAGVERIRPGRRCVYFGSDAMLRTIRGHPLLEKGLPWRIAVPPHALLSYDDARRVRDRVVSQEEADWRLARDLTRAATAAGLRWEWNGSVRTAVLVCLPEDLEALRRFRQ